MRSLSQLALRDEYSPPNLTHRAYCRAHLPNILTFGTNMGQENIGVVFMCSLYHQETSTVSQEGGSDGHALSAFRMQYCTDSLFDVTGCHGIRNHGGPHMSGGK